MVSNDCSLYKRLLWNKDKAKKGVSKTVVTKTYIPLAQESGVMERDNVDLKIMKIISANGIPFNMMRSPQYYKIITHTYKDLQFLDSC